MKYWLKSKTKDGQECVYLKGDDERVLLVEINNNNIHFTEACDEWFSIKLSKEESVEALQELIKYINNGYK